MYSGFSDEISKTMTIFGAQRFIFPLLRSLGERCVILSVFRHVTTTSPLCSIHEHRVSSLFSTLINTPNAPSVVVKELSRILIRLTTLPPDADPGTVETETREKNIRVARSLLSLVHQRHLELLRGVADDVLSEACVKAGESNEDKKERRRMANELLTSFSLVSEALSIPILKLRRYKL